MSDFQLVDPDFVDRCLESPASGRRWLVLEAHFSSVDHPARVPDRDRRHIPGAIEVHPSYLEAGRNRGKYYPNYSCPEDGNLLPAEELALALERLGIRPDTPVIVYGSEPDGAMAAARLAWGLLYAGVETVRLLDGGLDAWRDRGKPTVSRIEEACEVDRRADRNGGERPRWHARPEYLARTPEVRRISTNPALASSRLVDVRTRGEWDGSCTRHYPFFSVAGHIPTAIHQGDWDTLVDGKTQRLEPRLNEVASRWRELGILDAGVANGETTLIFCCGTGWRSSLSFLLARLMGLRAKNYDDGFYGWSWNRENELVAAGPTDGNFPRDCRHESW